MTEEQLCPLCGDLAVINESSKLTIEALLAERDIYRELVNNTSIHLSELKAEVERLKAHTWEQERAAIVEWLREKSKTYHRKAWCELVDILAQYIEQGEHWPTEG